MAFVTALASLAVVIAAQLLPVAPSVDDVAVERATRVLRTVRPEISTPPIVVIDGSHDLQIHTSMVAFRLRDKRTGVLDSRIYVNSATAMYRLAIEQELVGVVMLAAALVHETEHGQSEGEADAYAKQAEFVRAYLLTQPMTTTDREALEYNLVNLQNLCRIERDEERRHVQHPSR